MGTEYLVIIILWCGQPINTSGNSYGTESKTAKEVNECRKDAIKCVRKLEAFTTDDVVDKCLLKTR